MAFFLPSILVQGIYTGIIGTISSITINTCSMVKTLYTHENPNVNKIIKEIDIDRRLKLIRAVINVINADSIKSNSMTMTDLEKTQIVNMVDSFTANDVGPNDDPIALCLEYLKEIIIDIHSNINEINVRVKYHNTKWFSKWRSLDIDSVISDLKTNSLILDSRFKDLTKISRFLSERNNNN